MSPHRPAQLLWSVPLVLSCLASASRAQLPPDGTPVQITPVEQTDPACFLFEADYLLWYLDRDRVNVPLAVTAGDGAGPFDTRPLFGNQRLGASDPRSGLRLRAGLIGNDGYGFQVSGFLLERAVSNFVANPAAGFDQALLARPFTDAATGLAALNVLNFGTGSAGSIRVTSNTQLWGAEAVVTSRGGFGPFEGYYAGYRYLGLRDRLTITDRTTTQLGGLGFFNGQPVNEGDTRVKTDQFETSNDFHGAHVGVKAAARSGAFDVSLRSSVALGVTQQTVDVRGSTALEPAGGGGAAAAALPGGLLAAPSNIGSRTQATFAVVPEVDVSVGYQVAPWARLSVGYNFLYVSSVVRAGEQIDPVVSTAQLPTSPAFNGSQTGDAPRPLFKQSDFWAQGLNFGLSLSF